MVATCLWYQVSMNTREVNNIHVAWRVILFYPLLLAIFWYSRDPTDALKWRLKISKKVCASHKIILKDDSQGTK